MARNMYHPEELPVPDPEQQAALVQAWAGLLGRRDVLILDTETTSLDRPEVVDISIIDTRGYRRMDRLVMPKYGIEQGAQRVHWISIEHLSERQAPTFDIVEAVTDDGDPLVSPEPVGAQRTGRTRAGGTAVSPWVAGCARLGHGNRAQGLPLPLLPDPDPG